MTAVPASLSAVPNCDTRSSIVRGSRIVAVKAGCRNTHAIERPLPVALLYSVFDHRWNVVGVFFNNQHPISGTVMHSRINW